MPPVKRALLGWGLLAFALSAPVFGASQASQPEYQIKAVFLFNFTLFTEWPPVAFESAEAPFVIGIVGDDPFGRFLDDAVRGEAVNGHPVVVRRTRRLEDLPTCHVLFVSQSESGRLRQVIAAIRGRPILTVSEIDNFTAGGGMIRFVREASKVRLRVNVEAAKSAGIVLSSTLLRSAEIAPQGG